MHNYVSCSRPDDPVVTTTLLYPNVSAVVSSWRYRFIACPYHLSSLTKQYSRISLISVDPLFSVLRSFYYSARSISNLSNALWRLITFLQHLLVECRDIVNHTWWHIKVTGRSIYPVTSQVLLFRYLCARRLLVKPRLNS
jgi:hypothetical protein